VAREKKRKSCARFWCAARFEKGASLRFGARVVKNSAEKFFTREMKKSLTHNFATRTFVS
jgi:hypothetical protein